MKALMVLVIGLSSFAANAKLISQGRDCGHTLRVEKAFIARVLTYDKVAYGGYKFNDHELGLVVEVSTDKRYVSPQFSFSSDRKKLDEFVWQRADALELVAYKEALGMDHFGYNGEFTYLGEKNGRHHYRLRVREAFEAWQWRALENDIPKSAYEFSLGMSPRDNETGNRGYQIGWCSNVKGVR